MDQSVINYCERRYMTEKHENRKGNTEKHENRKGNTEKQKQKRNTKTGRYK